MLKKLPDLAEFDWISRSLWKLGERQDGGEGHTIRHLLPDRFESYFKILHPMYRDTSISDKTRPWGRNDDFRESDLQRVSWKELADEYDVPYHNQINPYAYSAAFGRDWPRYLLGADEGTLDEPLLLKLADVLGGHTSSSKWLFEYFIVATKDIQSDELYVGEKSDLKSANEQACCGAGPTYWWPEDRTWCVCTDYDLAFTVVGSSREAAKEIAGTAEFEGFEMRISDRIDYESHTAHG